MYDITSEKAVRKHFQYYHVTAIKNIDEIKKNGLKSNDQGLIFVFTDRLVEEEIAGRQCFLSKYALFRISSLGITGKVIRDRVAEFAAPYHRIIIQEKIHKRYVEFCYSTEIDFDKPSRWDIFKLRRSEGLS